MKISDLIISSDNQVIAMSKPAGMPVQEDPSGDKSLHRISQAYCKHDLHIVNRLDRPVSGVVIMAKNPKAAAFLSDQFASGRAEKRYLAIVPKGIQPPEAELTNRLLRDNRGYTRVVADDEEGQVSKLRYRVLGELDNYAVLQVLPLTGRTHQIRAQLAAIGHPVKGDVKYGSRRGNKDRSINLHCYQIQVEHPTRKQPDVYTAPLPDDALWDSCREIIASTEMRF